MARRETVTFQLDSDYKEELEESAENMSSRLREMTKAWLDVEEELEVRDDVEDMSLTVLKSYRNALIKNREHIQAQIDKLNTEIEKIEDEDEENEVLFTVELDSNKADL